MKKLIWVATAALVLTGCGLFSSTEDENSDGTIVLPSDAVDQGTSGLIVNATTPPASPPVQGPGGSGSNTEAAQAPDPSTPTDPASSSDTADGTATPTDGGASGEGTDGQADAVDTLAAEDTVDSLPRTGGTLVLALVGMVLLALGYTTVATGKHLWLRAQLTNCFRIEPLTSTFRVQQRRRRR